MALGEFDLIRRFFASASVNTDLPPDLVLGIGDDAAIIRVDAQRDFVITTDTMVAGRHFPLDTSPSDIAHKLAHVNLSDCAAMGASPRFATLALCLPQADESWLAAFAQTLQTQLQQHGVCLLGGDTTSGPLNLNLTLIGEVPSGSALRRDRAQVGDVIALTGTLGDAALGLQLALQAQHLKDANAREYLLRRLHRPQARVQAGQLIRPHAHAGIDISDGLIQDLRHVLQRSNVGAIVDIETLPLSTALRHSVSNAQALDYALYGGDDYELLVTLAEPEWSPLQARMASAGMALTQIGRITAGSVLTARYCGQPFALQARGFDHFSVDDISS